MFNVSKQNTMVLVGGGTLSLPPEDNNGERVYVRTCRGIVGVVVLKEKFSAHYF